MLQRIYGNLLGKTKDLQALRHSFEEAAKRDHRKLGKQLGLFHMQEELRYGVLASGMVGQPIKCLNNIYVSTTRKRLFRGKTPQVVDRIFVGKSLAIGQTSRQYVYHTHSENRDYAVKPMNCPYHVQILTKV